MNTDETTVLKLDREEEEQLEEHELEDELEEQLEDEDELKLELELDSLPPHSRNSILVIRPEPGASISCKRKRSRPFDQSMTAGVPTPPGLAGTVGVAMMLFAVSLSMKSQTPDPRLCSPVILMCVGR